MRFADVFRIAAFRTLYLAEIQSLVGDQLSRVALSVLVFERTGSASATALTYAATFLPAILGGVLFARIGDRLPRRVVMICCDLARGALFAAMAVPALPLWVVVGLLVVAVLIGPVFSASQVGYLAVALPAEEFRMAAGLRSTTSQVAQVGGFALGGVLVAALHPHGALLFDAVTFAASALVIALFVRPAPAAVREKAAAPPRPSPPPSARHRATEELAPPFPGLIRDRRLRALMAMAGLAGFFVVPEGLAVPYARAVGAGDTEVGFLLAAIPLGGALGAMLLVRLVPPRRRPLVADLMAVACGLPLLVTALEPAWPVTCALWFVSGALSAFQVEVITSLVQAIPDALRAHLTGVIGGWLTGSQGIGLAAAAAVAKVLSVGTTIGLAGVVGSGLAFALGLRSWNSNPGRDRADRPGAHARAQS